MREIWPHDNKNSLSHRKPDFHLKKNRETKTNEEIIIYPGMKIPNIFQPVPAQGGEESSIR